MIMYTLQTEKHVAIEFNSENELSEVKNAVNYILTERYLIDKNYNYKQFFILF